MDLNMGDMMSNIRNMSERMKEQQASLASQVVTGDSGGGMVTARMNGAGELVGLDIEKDVIDPEDPEMLADLIVAAVNAAHTKSSAAKMESMKDMTGGIDLSSLGIDIEGMM